MQRAISDTFLNEFFNNRSLAILLEALHNDTTLLMEFRGRHKAEIYYRGRLLTTVTENVSEIERSYTLKCNNTYIRKYGEYWKERIGYNSELNMQPTVTQFVTNLPLYKAPVDFYLSNVKSYLEEQCKQQLVLENNVFGKKTDKSGDYFILDTEYAFKDDGIDARFDAIALKWPSTILSRKNNQNLGISFLELKYNDTAKTGKAGIKKHIDDYVKFTARKEYHDMCRDMEEVFRKKCILGLIPAYNQEKREDCIKIGIDDNNVDLVFVLANSDPDSYNDRKEWDAIKEDYNNVEEIDSIYMAKASDLGYVLFRYGCDGEKDLYMKIRDYYK